MEESEKRKERLKAMRLEASASSSSSPQQALKSSLSNPLLEDRDCNIITATPPSRFGYYTDPLAAYTSDKCRPSTPAPPCFSPSSTRPRNSETCLVDAPQFHHNYAPHQCMYQGGHSPGMHGPTNSPMGIRSPFLVHQGDQNMSGAPGSGPWFNNYQSPGSGYGGTPFPVHQGSPNFRSPQGRGHWSNNSPNANLGHGGITSLGPGRGGVPSPGLGRGGGPSPGSGRGRAQWHDCRMSPNSGYSGGRGRGGGYYDGQGRSFYNRSMVEDPWESLTPVLWQGDQDSDVVGNFAIRRGPFKGSPFHKSPFQKTQTPKKPRVSSPFGASNSKQSLAEFLSESFDEGHQTVEDASTV